MFAFAMGRFRDVVFGSGGGPHRDTNWNRIPGVNFLRVDDEYFECVDHGGIYEDRLTSSSTKYPSQVGMDLYTSSSAAYLFDWCLSHDQNGYRSWAEAVASARRFFDSFHSVPRQRIEFDHREFDYAPLHLTFGHSVSNRFRGWTNYDPVNVYALRWDNIVHGDESRMRRLIKATLIKKALLRNQHACGLLPDNFRGSVRDSVDLTYHQFSLACLALGNWRAQDAKIDKIIRKGLSYSLATQLPTGEVSYYGRGSNNFYHLVAFIVALLYVGAVHHWPIGDNLRRALAYLNSHRMGRIDCLFPTAMNTEPIEKMIGWHGSCHQYGAQSAVLLARGLEQLLGSSQRNRLPAVPRAPADAVSKRHHLIRSQELVVAVTTGGERIAWDNGRHLTGNPGMTALCYRGKNLLVTNEECREKGIRQVCNDLEATRVRCSFIRTYEESLTMHLVGRDPSIRHLIDETVTYQLRRNRLVVTLSSSSRRRLPRHGLALAAPLVECDANGSWALLSVLGTGLIRCRANQTLHLRSVPVSGNCKGKGTYITFVGEVYPFRIDYELI